MIHNVLRLVENVVVLNMKEVSELLTSASLVLDHVKSYLYNESPDKVFKPSISLYWIRSKGCVIPVNKKWDMSIFYEFFSFVFTKK